MPQRDGMQRLDRDKELVESLRRQEPGAPEALLAAYGDRVLRLALRITGNASDAEEVVQDTFWAVTFKIDTFRGEAAFGSWLYRITANTAYQHLRRRRKERKTVPWDSLPPMFDQSGQDVEPGTDWSARVGEPALQAELRTMLEAAIAKLPATYRPTFLLRDVEGLSNLEVAETLHLKVVAVKARAHRARLFLRRRLTEYQLGGSLA